MIVDFPDVRGQPIKKLHVVADDQHGHLRSEQKGLEPGLRGFVQMVRRLVKHQHVGVGKQKMPQRHPHAIASREGVQRSSPVGFCEPEPGQNSFRFMFRVFVAMGGLKNGPVRGHVEFLREISDAEPGPLSDRTIVGPVFADHHAEQGGFARSVPADEADAGFRTKMGRGLGKERFRRVPFGDRLNVDHRSIQTDTVSVSRRASKERSRKWGKIPVGAKRCRPVADRWWSWPGLNRRPRECHSRALPTAPQPHVETFSEKQRNAGNVPRRIGWVKKNERPSRPVSFTSRHTLPEDGADIRIDGRASISCCPPGDAKIR